MSVSSAFAPPILAAVVAKWSASISDTLQWFFIILPTRLIFVSLLLSLSVRNRRKVLKNCLGLFFSSSDIFPLILNNYSLKSRGIVAKYLTSHFVAR